VGRDSRCLKQSSQIKRRLAAYAERNDLAYEYEYTPAFAKWQRLLSPEQYEIVEVRTSRRLSRVMLFSKAIIRAERAAILTSTFCLVEVCKAPTSKKTTSDKLAEFFENDYILITNLDRMVAERGRELMIAYGSLKPPDAVHIATAAVSPGVEEMHTFDDRLLKLDGLIDKADGTNLKICKPDAGAPPAPLLEAVS
jgi:predicted nucleic acid-binding protein